MHRKSLKLYLPGAILIYISISDLKHGAAPEKYLETSIDTECCSQEVGWKGGSGQDAGQTFKALIQFGTNIPEGLYNPL